MQSKAFFVVSIVSSIAVVTEILGRSDGPCCTAQHEYIPSYLTLNFNIISPSRISSSIFEVMPNARRMSKRCALQEQNRSHVTMRIMMMRSGR